MRLIFPLLLSLLLSACFTAGKRGGDAAMAVYDLGPGQESPVERSTGAPMAIEVRAPLWFDSLGIDYRLAYAEPERLREYARARWAGPPAQLIQRRLMRDLDLIAAGQGRAACVLRLEIDEFSQIFDTPASSRAVVQGRVQWLDRGRGRLAERPVSLVQPAPSADSRGAVSALTAAVAQLTVAIVHWEKALRADGQLRGCQP